MVSAIGAKLKEVVELCEKHNVERLVLFGSAARGQEGNVFNDLDFLVEFRMMNPREHANSFFGLLEDLERLFGCPIDLVEREPITNPYFLKSIEQQQVLIYEAA